MLYVPMKLSGILKHSLHHLSRQIHFLWSPALVSSLAKGASGRGPIQEDRGTDTAREAFSSDNQFLNKLSLAVYK